MKNKKWIGVLGIIGILLNILPFGAFTSVSADSVIQDGGTFYQDVPEAANSPLGAAQYFHIFANDVTLRTHTNGNIAAKNFNGGNANFGTNGYLDKEYFYLDNVQSINGNSGITGEDHNKLVVGASVSVDISNPNRPKINDTNMDHLTASQIYQDQGTNQYINFTEEMERLSNASQKITSATPDLTFSASDFPDRNNRVIDVSSINKSAVFITLSADVLQTGTPLNIAGLEKGYDCSEVKSVFITVDTEGQDVYNSNSQINLSYTDGSERHNHEATDFSDSTILWNFTSMGTPYNGTVTIQSPWQGSILAPKATIDGSGVNIDGSIMADKFLGAGETHRWDWHGCFHSKEVGSVLLTKTDAKDQTKVLAGAEFSLYNSDGKLIKDGLTTDENGQLSYENLAIGNYYFVETKAPTGYQIDVSEHHFEIKAGETAKPVGVTVTNEVDKEVAKEEVGSVLLTKTDAKDQTKVLAGAEFSLYNSDGKLIKDGLTTDENGQLSYENLAIGNYYFVETKAPTGYQIDVSEHHFEIKAGETAKPVGVTVTNEADKEEVGSVLLTKTDAKDQTKVLAGAEFSLYNSDGKLIKDGLTTDENGQLSYENLAIGNYYFVETKAPTGYQIDVSEHHFEIKAGETAKPVGVTVTNEVDKEVAKEEVGSVLLTKTDAKDQTKVLAGAEFSLYNSDGKLIKDGLTTDENGQLSYENLAIGNYYFVETKAPTGYQIDASEHHFEIKAGETAKPVGVTVTNEADKEKGSNLPKTGMKSESSLLVIGALLLIMGLASIWIRNRNKA